MHTQKLHSRCNDALESNLGKPSIKTMTPQSENWQFTLMWAKAGLRLLPRVCSLSCCSSCLELKYTVLQGYRKVSELGTESGLQASGPFLSPLSSLFSVLRAGSARSR